MRRALLVLNVVLTCAMACSAPEEHPCSCGADHLYTTESGGQVTGGRPAQQSTKLTALDGDDARSVSATEDPFVFELQVATSFDGGGVEDAGADDADADAEVPDAEVPDAEAGVAVAPRTVTMVRLRSDPKAAPELGVHDLADLGAVVWTCDAPGVFSHSGLAGFTCYPEATRRTISLVGTLEVLPNASGLNVVPLQYRVDARTVADPHQPAIVVAGTVFYEPDSRVYTPVSSNVHHECY